MLFRSRATAAGSVPLGGPFGKIVAHGILTLLPASWGHYLLAAAMAVLGLGTLYLACALTLEEWHVIVQFLHRAALRLAEAVRHGILALARLLRNMLAGLDDAQAQALLRSEGFARLMAPLVQGSMVLLFDAQGAVRLGRDWHTVQAHEWDGEMPGIQVSNTHAWTPKPGMPAPAGGRWRWLSWALG